LPNVGHFTPDSPCATSENPIIAPTMLCVPDTGRLKNVAIRSHTLVPVRADMEPTIARFSVPLKELMSMIPFRTVSEVEKSVK
jgi:hypothetical protein